MCSERRPLPVSSLPWRLSTWTPRSSSSRACPCSVPPSAPSSVRTWPSTESRTGSWSRPPSFAPRYCSWTACTWSLLGGFAVVTLILVLGLLWPASFGMGDVKLALLIVAGLGGVAAQALVVGLVLAAVFGALLILRDGRSAGGRALPLAPFVAAGAALAMLA